MNNKKPASRKEMRDRRRQENFVGRSEQMRQFEENFLRDDPLMVFSVTGEGGVGKSTLLKHGPQWGDGGRRRTRNRCRRPVAGGRTSIGA
jgi:hypothetical protein